MPCDVKNVLYVIRCLGCNEYYIGQTGGKLRERRTIQADKRPLDEKNSLECTFGRMQ